MESSAKTPWNLLKDQTPWNLPNDKNNSSMEISGKKRNAWQQISSSQRKQQNIGKTVGDRRFYDPNDKNSLSTSSSSQRKQRNIGKTVGARRLYEPNDKNSSSMKFSLGVSDHNYNKSSTKRTNHPYHNNRWNRG